MRHASRAAGLLATLSLATTLSASCATEALAIDSPGGTAAPTAGSAAVTGGASSSAPSTKGTGGTAYGVLPRKPVRVVHHKAAKPKPKPKPKPPAAAPTPVAPTQPPPAGAPAPAQLASDGAVFPVAGPHSYGDAANRFGAGRAGYLHQGQDVLASEGLPVLAPLAGTIITTGFQAGGAGWYVAEHTTSGVDFFYAHCQAGSLAVSGAGQAVSAGQELCKVGQTGDATGPHLHFEIWVGGWRASGGMPIDPLPYLQAWDHG